MEYGRLLSSLQEPDRARVLQHAVRRELAAGEYLFRTGEPVDSVCFPVQGMLAVSEESGKGDRRITALIGPDGFALFTFGLGDDVPAPVDCWAVLDTSYLAVPTSVLRRLIHEIPALGAALLAYLGWTTRRMSDHLRVCGQYGIKERTAATLLEFALLMGTTAVPIPQKVLAERIGARRETVAVALGQLREERIVRTRYRRVLVNSLEALRTAAGGAAPRM